MAAKAGAGETTGSSTLRPGLTRRSASRASFPDNNDVLRKSIAPQGMLMSKILPPLLEDEDPSKPTQVLNAEGKKVVKILSKYSKNAELVASISIPELLPPLQAEAQRKVSSSSG
jgi:hypothetical protein